MAGNDEGSAGATPRTSTEQPAYAMWVVLGGLAAIVVVSAFAILHYASASDAVTALAPVTGIISALVGAYFGLRGASLGQQKANEGVEALARLVPRGGVTTAPLPAAADGAAATVPGSAEVVATDRT